VGRDVSIAISAKDNFTTAITTMRNANQSFNKDLTGLQSKLDAFNKTKIGLKVDMSKAKSELQAAEKQFMKTGDAADKLKMVDAQLNFENANRNLQLVSSNARQAEKDMLSLTNATSKQQNRAGSSSGGTKDLLGGLGASGIAAELGSVASGIANSYVSSAYGDTAGTAFSSILGEAGTGAALGTAIAPGIGTVVGAAVGGLVGTIQGLTKAMEKKDDYFKDYYKDLYGTVTQAQTDALTNGSGTAAGRETTRLSFKTLLGSGDAANDFVNKIQTIANVTPFEFGDLTAISKSLLAYHYSADDVLKTLNDIGEAGSALGMNTADMQELSQYLGTMSLTGKTTMEYLKPMMERGIDVYSAIKELPKYASKTNAQIQDMVSKGLIPGADAAKAIADYMGKTYAGSMAAQSQTFTGLTSTLEDAKTQLNEAMGEGYNNTRKSGLQAEIDYYGGNNGDDMQDAYKKIGQYKASLENEKEKLVREALSTVTTGTLSASYEQSSQKTGLEAAAKTYSIAQASYYDASKSGDTSAMEAAGAKMGQALAEAQAIAANEYNATDGAQSQLESNKILAEDIKNDTSLQSEYYDAGYTMGEQFSKGYQSGIAASKGASTNLGSQGYNNWNFGGVTREKSSAGSTSAAGQSENFLRTHGYASGLDYVPYDNFPARLHLGEGVLTANENRQRKSGGVPAVTVTGNTFYVRQDSDIDAIASTIVNKMIAAKELAG